MSNMTSPRVVVVTGAGTCGNNALAITNLLAGVDCIMFEGVRDQQLFELKGREIHETEFSVVGTSTASSSPWWRRFSGRSGKPPRF